MNATCPIKLVLFDLDGTIYLDGVLMPGVTEVLERLTREGIDYAFMTNNSSVAPADYLDKLRRLGLTVAPRNIITSSQATCLMLAEFQLGPEIFVVGTDKFQRYLESQGYHPSQTRSSAVLVGFDLELTYDKLTTAVRLLAGGVPLVASHADVFCPSADGPLPDAGTVLAALTAATGVKPRAVAGKPHRWMVQLVRQNFNVKAGQILLVGDRLQTDIKMARRYKMRSILPLTGATTRSELERSRLQPDLVVNSVADLADSRIWARVFSA